MWLQLVAQVPGDSPSWTDKLEAIATTVGAAVTTLTIVVLAYQLLDQRSQTRLQAAQARKQQAERITVSMTRGGETADGVIFDHLVENRSGRPCYFTYLEVFDGDEVAYFRFGTVDNSPAAGQVELGKQHRSTPPGEPRGRTWPYFRISFMDAANVFWIRDSHGILTETRDGIPTEWPATGTFAEKRAQQVTQATGQRATPAPSTITPADMWVARGRAPVTPPGG